MKLPNTQIFAYLLQSPHFQQHQSGATAVKNWLNTARKLSLLKSRKYDKMIEFPQEIYEHGRTGYFSATRELARRLRKELIKEAEDSPKKLLAIDDIFPTISENSTTGKLVTMLFAAKGNSEKANKMYQESLEGALVHYSVYARRERLYGNDDRRRGRCGRRMP